MKTRQDIIRELSEAGIALDGGPFATPYAVPAGYFEALAETILRRVRASEVAAELDELSPLLAGIPKKMPFAVPAGYFEAIQIGAEAETPEFLAGMNRSMPYDIPQGYFESLPVLLSDRVAPKAKVVAMRPLRWMRIASAAVVAAAMAIGGWMYTHPAPSLQTNPQAWMEKRLHTVPDSALDEFIETADPVHGAELAQNGKPRTEVRQMLRDVSETEMDAFLEQVPTEDETINSIN